MHHHETMGDGQLLVNTDYDQNMVTGSYPPKASRRSSHHRTSNGSLKEIIEGNPLWQWDHRYFSGRNQSDCQSIFVGEIMWNPHLRFMVVKSCEIHILPPFLVVFHHHILRLQGLWTNPTTRVAKVDGTPSDAGHRRRRLRSQLTHRYCHGRWP